MFDKLKFFGKSYRKLSLDINIKANVNPFLRPNINIKLRDKWAVNELFIMCDQPLPTSPWTYFFCFLMLIYNLENRLVSTNHSIAPEKVIEISCTNYSWNWMHWLAQQILIIKILILLLKHSNIYWFTCSSMGDRHQSKKPIVHLKIVLRNHSSNSSHYN